MQTTIVFDKKNDNDCEIRLARFIAQLIREGIVFTLRADAFSYEVTLTGGY